jgi:hypothetical protein
MDHVQPFIGSSESPSVHKLTSAGGTHLPTPAAGAKPMEADMRDEIYDRDYQAGRDALHDGIDRLVAGIGQTFRVMAAIQFSSPWAKASDRRSLGT